MTDSDRAPEAPSPTDRAADRAAPAASDGVQSTAIGALLQKLSTAPKLDAERFALEGELGKGGMGVVLRVHDRFLNRRLAMKVLLERATSQDDDPRLGHQLLGRFLEEAQVTSQLDHPGVVPVHELGLDQRGKLFFTMRMVKGRTAREAFADAYERRDGSDLTRALEIVLKVCDTMAYAHDKGVLHRDLKPSNVMVGRFGEVYVMDWCQAKVTGQQERHDLRIGPHSTASLSRLESVRRDDADSDADNSVVSMDGQQLGTPSYMSPEQARSEELDARADVYSIGAMLYELVTGRPPYTTPGVRQPAYRILNDVAEGPPRPIEELQKNVPGELVAVIEKAMARDRDQRYPSVLALASDLRAFLSHQVVRAYRTGAWQETRLWIRRNKPLAASLAAAFLLLVGAVIITLVLGDAARRAEQDAKARAVALATKMAEFDQLAMVVDYERLMQEEMGLLTAYPDQLEAIDDWLRRAQGLVRRRAELRKAVVALRQEADAARDGEAGRAPASGEEMAVRFLAQSLDDLVGKLPRLAVLLPDMQRARRWAEAVGPLTKAHPNARMTWDEARAQVAVNPRYAGQDLPLRDRDVSGLVPIGCNPKSGLLEVYDLRSAWDGSGDPGELARLPIPTHRADGGIAMTGASGIVFVLVPGGALPRGPAAAGRPTIGQQRYLVQLDPFFLAKHEMTQGQWLRTNGDNPAASAALEQLALPVESINWSQCREALRRLGQALPSQLQWEYAIRGGTTTTWWSGNDERSILAAENVGAQGRMLPVGSRSPNPFGLFDMGGNVSEWCDDAYGGSGSGNERDGDGRRPDDIVDQGSRTVAGGYADSDASLARSDASFGLDATYRTRFLGLRPARAVRRN
ncbi:MAG: protein kinase domain-containing protein [Planctomycetota bacterium]